MAVHPSDNADWFQRTGDAARAGEVLAGRYVLVAPLGRGAYGAVWRADDRVRGDQVALKFLKPRGPERARQSLHEIATLRRLDVAGVARLRDYADEDGEIRWLAMDIARGRPFGPAEGRVAWDEIADATRRLLAILTEVHARGVVHRDLKPSNVFVDDDGEVTVLDFGVAWNPELDGVNRKRVVGTPRYLAPEQLRGVPGDARTDLYAVGTMLFHALSGQWPYDVHDASLLAVKARRPARCLGDVAPDVPPAVARAIDDMLAIRPQLRPGTAADALARLDDPTARDAFVTIVGEGDDEVDADTMITWFAGPERILHLQSDAVTELRARGVATRDAALALLQRWRRARRCWARDGRIVIPRQALDRLADERNAATTGPRLRLSLDPRERIDTLLAEVDTLLAANDGHRALPLLEILVREPLTDDERTRCIAWMCVAALELVTGASVRMARYLVERYDAADRVRPIADALDAFARASVGDADGAVAIWRRLPRTRWPHVDEKLAMLVMPMLQALREPDRAALLAETIHPWLDAAPPLRASRLRIDAWADYAEYRFESAAQRLEGAAAAGDGDLRLNLLSNAASAWLEAGRFDDVRRLVDVLRTHPDTRHNPALALRAEWLDRAATYRSCAPCTPDDDLMAIATAHGTPQDVLLIAVNEAAVAWRQGDLRRVRAYEATASAHAGTAGTARVGLSIIRAICANLEGETDSGEALAPDNAPPRIRAQIEALRGLSPPGAGIERLFPQFGRAEVLGRSECFAADRVTPRERR